MSLNHARIFALTASPKKVGFKRRLRVLIDVHTARGPYTRKTQRALAALYEAQGDAERAAHWRAVLEKALPVEAASAAPDAGQ